MSTDMKKQQLKESIARLLESELKERGDSVSSFDELSELAEMYVENEDTDIMKSMYILEENWDKFEPKLQKLCRAEQQANAQLEESKQLSQPAAQQIATANAPTISEKSPTQPTPLTSGNPTAALVESTKPASLEGSKVNTSNTTQEASAGITTKRKQPDENGEDRKLKKQMTDRNDAQTLPDGAGANAIARSFADSPDAQHTNGSQTALLPKKRCNRYYDRGYCEFHDNCKFEHGPDRVAYNYAGGPVVTLSPNQPTVNASRSHVGQNTGPSHNILKEQPPMRKPGPDPELIKAKQEQVAKELAEKQRQGLLLQTKRQEIEKQMEKAIEEWKEQLGLAGQKNISAEQKSEAVKKAREKQKEIDGLRLQLGSTAKPAGDLANTPTRGGYHGRGRGGYQGRASMTLDNRKKTTETQ